MGQKYRVTGNNPSHCFDLGDIVEATGKVYVGRDPDYKGSIQVVSVEGADYTQWIQRDSLVKVKEETTVTYVDDVPSAEEVRAEQIAQLRQGDVIEVDDGFVVITDIDIDSIFSRCRGIRLPARPEPERTWLVSNDLRVSNTFIRTERSTFDQ